MKTLIIVIFLSISCVTYSQNQNQDTTKNNKDEYNVDKVLNNVTQKDSILFREINSDSNWYKDLLGTFLGALLAGLIAALIAIYSVQKTQKNNIRLEKREDLRD